MNKPQISGDQFLEPRHQTHRRILKALRLPAVIASLAGLFALSRVNYLLFHSLVELGAVAVAWSVFLLIWNARRLDTPAGFVLLGVGYLLVGGLDLLHTLAYEGMGVFLHAGVDLATQLWIAARYIEAATLVLFPLSLSSVITARVGKAALATGAAVLAVAIFIWNDFPVCFDPQTGLTAFKMVSEYAVMAALGLAALLTWQRRHLIGNNVAPFMVCAMLVTILSEFSFTLYTSPFGLANMTGHLLKVVSLMLIYRALIVEGLERPLETLGRGLREENERYVRIIETATDGFWIVDLEGRIQEANETAARMVDYPPDALLSMGLRDMDAIETDEETDRHLERIVKNGFDRFETRLRRKDGSIIDVEVSCSYLPRHGGQIVAFMRDISERKKSEMQLRFQAALSEQISDAVIATDLNLHITSWNTAATAIYGWLADEAMGNHIDELLQTEWFDQALEEAQATLRRTGRWNGEVRQKTKDGKTLTIEASVSWVYDGKGQPIGGVTVNRDVTDRRKAEDALKQSEQRYRGFIEHTSEGVYMLALDRPIPVSLPVEAQIDALYDLAYVAECNDAFAMMYGLSGGTELVGQRLIDFHGGRDHPVNRREVERFVLSGYRLHNEETLEKGQDGRERWFANGTVGIVEDGFLVRMWGTQMDVTDRKLAARAVAESEARYRSIVQVLPDLLFRIDAETRFTDVQTTSPEMLLHPADEIIGKTAAELLPPDVAELTRKKCLTTLAGGEMQIYGYALEMANGRRVCETRMVPCGAGEVLAIVRDVTEMRAAEQQLRESEARYNAVVNDQTELICRFGPDGVLSFVNAAYCRYFGGEAEGIIGRRFTQFIPDEDRKFVQQQFLSLSLDCPIRTYEHHVIGADGKHRWMEWTDRAIFDDAGDLMEYQAVGRDITERKELQHRLMGASEHEQKRLAQELHDGLCQDLKGLEIQAALIEDRFIKSDAVATDLAVSLGKEINLAVRRAYGIARGMLPVHLDIEGFSDALRELAEENGCHVNVRIVASIEERLLPQTEMQAYHIYRIAQEAINNALRHAKGTAIELRWGRENGHSVLVVRDDGVGLNHENPGHTKGMGLMVMRSRADAIGARLTVRERMQGGTEVRVTLNHG